MSSNFKNKEHTLPWRMCLSMYEVLVQLLPPSFSSQVGRAEKGYRPVRHAAWVVAEPGLPIGLTPGPKPLCPTPTNP